MGTRCRKGRVQLMVKRSVMAVLLGRALKVLREQAGLTQRAAAAQMGCVVDTVSKDEQGGDGSRWTRGVQYRRIEPYARLYGVTVPELLVLSSEMERPEDSSEVPLDGSTDRATLEI